MQIFVNKINKKHKSPLSLLIPINWVVDNLLNAEL
jgi:hypothetical protein